MARKEAATFTWKLQSDLVDRMDPAFWDPALLTRIELLSRTPYPLVTLGKLQPFMTYGPIVTGSGLPNASHGPHFVNTAHLLPTGLASLEQRIPQGSAWDVSRCRVRHGDVLLARSGVATLGRCLVYLKHDPAVVGCYVNIIRQDTLDPCYLCVFLKSQHGQVQIERLKTGVGTANISFAQLRSIQIPLLPPALQSEVTRGYQKMHLLHEAGKQDRAHAQLGRLLTQLDQWLSNQSPYSSHSSSL